MRFIKMLIVFLAISCICSCVDTEEQIVIKEDNSGTYTSIMDMGKMIAMVNMMGGDNNADRKLENMDTLILLKDMMSTADSLSAAEKELYKDATVRIKLDKTNAEMKMTMSCPFRSLTQLPEIKENFMIVLNKMKAFDKISGKEGETADKMDNDDIKKSFTPNAVPFKFTATPGVIENSLPDAQSMTNMLQSDSTMIMMKQMTAMMGTPTYKTIITTPKEIRSYTGNEAKLSADKKTVSFTNTFSDMFEHPEKLAYKVEY